MNPLDEPPKLPCQRCLRQNVLWLDGNTDLFDRVGEDGFESEIFHCPDCATYYRWGEATWRAPQMMRRGELAGVLAEVRRRDAS